MFDDLGLKRLEKEVELQIVQISQIKAMQETICEIRVICGEKTVRAIREVRPKEDYFVGNLSAPVLSGFYFR